MAEDARELVERYARLLGEKGVARPGVERPPSLASAVARYDELSRLPSRELLLRGLAGLDELRSAWAGALGPTQAVELLALGMGGGSKAQSRLREARNEIAWLRTKNTEFDDQRRELERLFRDLDRLLAESGPAGVAEAELAAKEAEAHEAEARARALESRIGAVESQLDEAGTYIRRKEQEQLDAEAQWRRVAAYARAKEDELRQAEEREHAGGEAARKIAQIGMLAIQAQERMLNRALRPVLERLHAAIDPEGPLELPADGLPFIELLGAVAQLRRCVEVVTEELHWRRGRGAELEAELERAGADRQQLRTELEQARAELEWRRARMQTFVEQLGRHRLLGRFLARTRAGDNLAGWETGAPMKEEEGA
jgi:hypothetical protein